MGALIIIGLIILYIASAILLECEFAFQMHIDTVGSCLIVMCPILNTIVLAKAYHKRHIVKTISKIVKTISKEVMNALNSVKETLDKV